MLIKQLCDVDFNNDIRCAKEATSAFGSFQHRLLCLGYRLKSKTHLYICMVLVFN